MVFNSLGKRPILMTRWDFGRDEGSLVIIKDFLNTKVGPSQGTLVLSRDAARRKGLWKRGWVAGLIDYELYRE